MGSKLLVQMKRDFAVGPRAEMVAARLELAANAFEVIEFAVGDKANRSSSLAMGWSPPVRSMMLRRA